MRKLIALVLLLIYSRGYTIEAFSLDIDNSLSREGFISLSWNHSTTINDNIIIEIDNDRLFVSPLHSIELRGQNNVHLSGFEDGIYYARILSKGVPSNSIEFQVQHRSLTTAWSLFVAGLVLFCLLIVFMFWGTRVSRQSLYSENSLSSRSASSSEDSSYIEATLSSEQNSSQKQ